MSISSNKGSYDLNISGINLVKQCGWFMIRQRRDYFTAIRMYRCAMGTD